MFQEPEAKPDKGMRGGSCNRIRCQAAGATWYNRGTQKWYCEPCAHAINAANKDVTDTLGQGPLCITGKDAEQFV